MADRIKGITIEIDGDTTKLQSALKKVNTELRTSQNNLKDVNKLLKLDPGNTQLLQQKYKGLGKSIEETKKKLDMLKTAQQQMEQNGEVNTEEYDALQREIVETQQKLKGLEKEYKQFGSVQAQQVAAAGEKMKSAGDKISSVGTKMLPATEAVTGLGTAAVTTAASFESSMSQVQATMGITKDAMSTVDGQSVNTMDKLNELAKKMGSETAFSASECAQALNYLALAGYDTQQMCDTLPTVLNLAAAGDIDLASASDMVTDAMSALGMEVNEAGTMVDQMAKTASSTNTSVAQLGEGILKIGATARTIKGGTAELNTALGILANNGIKGAEGGTHLRNIILSLQNPTDNAAKAMDQLGLQVYDSQGNMRSMNDILGDLNKSMDGMTNADKSHIISKIFNKTDISSVNALLANTGDTWDELQQSIASSGGAAQQMADTQLDNLQGQLTILKSALEGLAISVGQLIMPLIKSLVGKMQSFVDWLNSLDEGTKKIVVTIALVAAAVGPVLIMIGKIASGIGAIMSLAPKISGAITAVKGAFAALNATLLANPIVLIIAAIIAVITALVAAFVYLWNHCEGFRNFWINLWKSVKQIAVTVWNGLKSFFTSAWNAISGTAKNVFNGIKAFFSTVWNGIKRIVMTVVNAIKNVVSTAWNGIRTVITTVMNTIKNIISTVWNGIKNTVGKVISGIKNVISSGMNGAKSVITGILDKIKSKFTSIWEGAKKIVSGAIEKIKGFMNFKWQLPKIKLPHFSVSGKLSLDPPSMPKFSVKWYKTAMENGTILNSPTIFGMQGGRFLGGGDAGPEAVVGVDSLRNMIQAAVAGAGGDTIIPVYIGQERIDEIVVKANKKYNYRSGGRS